MEGENTSNTNWELESSSKMDKSSSYLQNTNISPTLDNSLDSDSSVSISDDVEMEEVATDGTAGEGLWLILKYDFLYNKTVVFHSIP